MRVLLVEDHEPLARALRQGLEEGNVAIDTARDGDEAGARLRGTGYDVIILDLTLATADGLALLRGWRRGGIKTHVLALAGRGNLEDRVRGLDGGADDCLGVPFELEELLARLRALARRPHPAPLPVLRVYDLEIDSAARTVKRAGQVVALTRREYSLLEILARRCGKVTTRALIWNHLYDRHDQNSSNVVDVTIRQLRNKIDRGFDLPLILTQRGQGYLLRGEEREIAE